MHIILVRIVRSIQNSCIKYSTQNQHFAEIFTYSDNTNYNLNFNYFIVSIYLWFNLFGNYSYVSDVSDDPRWNFRVLSTAPITAPSFDETAGICAIVAVVDTRSLVGARNHCEGSVPYTMPFVPLLAANMNQFQMDDHWPSGQVAFGSSIVLSKHRVLPPPGGTGRPRPPATGTHEKIIIFLNDPWCI
jgi:hypothetical protein